MTITIDSLIRENQESLHALEGRLAYRFRDLAFLQKALLHRSFAYERGKALGKDNERLEFLGDAVLDLAVGFALFRLFPEMREGDLTKLRASLVNEAHLAVMARAIDLGRHLLLGRGEEVSQGRLKSSILASTYEAVLGAVFLDGGFAEASRLVEAHFAPWLTERQGEFVADSKSRLQEMLQERYNEPPVYVLENEEGPAHAKTFTISVRFREVVLATGSASSKKEAEQQAAARALDQLKIDSLPLAESPLAPEP